MSKIERKNIKEIPDVLKGADQQHAIELLEHAHQIKKQLGSERDKKTGKPQVGDAGYGLLAELADLKDELNMIQVANDLDGLRLGRIGAQSTYMDGRKYLSDKKLLDAGVSPEQIARGYAEGDGYYQVTLFELK